VQNEDTVSPGYPMLFSSFRAGPAKFRNRIVSPPMYQVRPTLSPAGIAWHRRFAAGGAGLVIVEGTSVRTLADANPADWRRLADAIHGEGALAAVQLVSVFDDNVTGPDDPSLDQLETLIGHFGDAAVTCARAGFEAVEPHGAHGFLLNQFFMPDRNHRTDRYGGSDEARGRLGTEIVRRIREQVDRDILILYRHTPQGEHYTVGQSVAFAQRLAAAGLDILDVSPACDRGVADLARPFKESLAIPVIAVGGMEDPDAAETALREGRCDLVAVGRQLIADAQWPNKVREGRVDQIVECKKCDTACFGNIAKGQPAACVQWPEGDPSPELAAFM